MANCICMYNLENCLFRIINIAAWVTFEIYYLMAKKLKKGSAKNKSKGQSKLESSEQV